MCRLVVVSLLIAATQLPCRPACGSDPLVQAMHAVVKIVNESSTATGFLVVCPPEGSSSDTRLLLVTAAHVFEQMSGETCRIVFRRPGEDRFWNRVEQRLPVRAGDRPCWQRHPQADVAVLPVHLPGPVTKAALPMDRIADQSAIATGKIRTGQDVWIPCYPAHLEANHSGFAVLRHGVISSYPLGPVATYKTFLVDYSTFGGDSGSPVVVQVPTGNGGSNPSGKALLVAGLVVGQHRQTEKVVLPFEQRITHHPLGLAIVVPGEFIRQTIRLQSQ